MSTFLILESSALLHFHHLHFACDHGQSSRAYDASCTSQVSALDLDAKELQALSLRDQHTRQLLEADSAYEAVAQAVIAAQGGYEKPAVSRPPIHQVPSRASRPLFDRLSIILPSPLHFIA